ncbi:hypothetical protein ACFY2V_35795 [Streptomyces eurythermus]|uniref:hypothetical protein n=1 Tax=Streptomyces eurythermus TaxID=42237 RepID=UPI0036BD811F
MAMKRRSVAQQKFGVRDQCVLDHEVPGGDVRPEYPYGLIDPAGAFQDPGLEVLRVAAFDTPPLSTAGAADPLSSRRDQLQNLLVTALALRQLDESGQDPRTVQVRGEYGDRLVQPPRLGQQFREVMAHPLRGEAFLVRADLVQCLPHPPRLEQNLSPLPARRTPPCFDERLQHLQGPFGLARPGQLANRSLGAEPFPPLRRGLNQQLHLALLQQHSDQARRYPAECP